MSPLEAGNGKALALEEGAAADGAAVTGSSVPAASGGGVDPSAVAAEEGGGGQHTPLFTEADKAERLDLCACGKVQTRAFHLAWTSFFVAFFAWFSIAPLLPIIRQSLNLTSRQAHYSNLASVGTTIIARVALGPWVDYLGPKTSMAALLLVGAVPFAFVPLVHSFAGLVTIRACIGVLGAAFVMAQAWTSGMFQRGVVGQANALVAGWGNLGGATAQLLMAGIYQALLPASSPSQPPADVYWQRALLLPPIALVLAAAVVYAQGVDTPKGDVAVLKKEGKTPPCPKASFAAAARDYMTWVLALHYAASFGVELTVLNTAASYFHEHFDTPPLTAGRLATCAGVSNVVLRPLGGWLSDRCNRRWGPKGRLALQFVLVLLEGAFLLRFAAARTQGAAAVYLLLASAFVQAANGSCFALVPYLSEQSGGAVTGIVGSGGNLGSIAYSLMFAEGHLHDPTKGFATMGWVALACAPSVWLIRPGRLEGGGTHERKRGSWGGKRGGRNEEEEGGERTVVVCELGHDADRRSVD